ncbi:Protein CBG25530 [Caenorhabditis briggsae]|uniref:Protein CBG25530 n=1 Tax=Caenorhabditis briggsae TaxID=6238 RepID=B6II53_CAEBR|nr:Protein CBG25530 [Caenorhabditis briggsae]CAR99583.1 Protein CBG25530 [Caenorhabditis briggsae]
MFHNKHNMFSIYSPIFHNCCVALCLFYIYGKRRKRMKKNWSLQNPRLKFNKSIELPYSNRKYFPFYTHNPSC